MTTVEATRSATTAAHPAPPTTYSLRAVRVTVTNCETRSKNPITNTIPIDSSRSRTAAQMPPPDFAATPQMALSESRNSVNTPDAVKSRMPMLIAVASHPDPGLEAAWTMSSTAAAPFGPKNARTCRSTCRAAPSSVSTTDTTLMVMTNSGASDRMVYRAIAADSRMALFSYQAVPASTNIGPSLRELGRCGAAGLSGGMALLGSVRGRLRDQSLAARGAKKNPLPGLTPGRPR